MKKFIAILALFCFSFLLWPAKSFAAGVFTSGNSSLKVGESTTVTVVASGTAFNEISGSISISGPVTVTSFATGTANWSQIPSGNGAFAGTLSESTNSLTIATISLWAASAGTAVVNVADAILKLNNEVVGTESSSTTIAISDPAEEVTTPTQETPPPTETTPDTTPTTTQTTPEKVLPGLVKVTSTTHPKEDESYESGHIVLFWNKEAGVDGFSYYLGTLPETIPTPAIDTDETGVSYFNKKPGTYYFHIRAHNKDGWGPATHFKINIKEAEPSVAAPTTTKEPKNDTPALDESLLKPTDIQVTKASNFTYDESTGSVSGILVTGKTRPGYTVTATFDPAITVPEGKSLSTVSDVDGTFGIVIDFPVESGVYKLSLQGQNDNSLTPISDEIKFEISQIDGDITNILSTSSETEINSLPSPKDSVKNKSLLMLEKYISYIVLGFLVIFVIGVLLYIRKKNRRVNGRRYQYETVSKEPSTESSLLIAFACMVILELVSVVFNVPERVKTLQAKRELIRLVQANRLMRSNTGVNVFNIKNSCENQACDTSNIPPIFLDFSVNSDQSGLLRNNNEITDWDGPYLKRFVLDPWRNYYLFVPNYDCGNNKDLIGPNDLACKDQYSNSKRAAFVSFGPDGSIDAHEDNITYPL